MHNVKHFAQRYVNWVIKLGRVRFSLLGLAVLAVFALLVQGLLSFAFVGRIYWLDVIRSIAFGLISAPFVIYFFTLLVEKLERSRLRLADTNTQLNANIIEINKIQKEVEQKAEFLRSFIDASPDLVFYRSDTGKFLGCNRAMELLTGKREQELLQLSPKDLFSQDAAEYMAQTDREILQTNEGITYEQWLKYPNGKLACFEIRKVPYFDVATQRHCIMGFGRDVTERKRYLDVIEKNSRDKTTLMATISHELRTPLNGIVGLSQILLDGPLTKEQRNYLNTIHISAVGLGHIFSDIIDLEKLDTRRIELLQKETDFTAFLNDIHNIATLMAEGKKLKFHMEYHAALPNWIIIDRTRLSQILWNLINNAVKFTAEGEIRLQIERPEPHTLRFILKDTGIGIPQNELIKIFAMYYQVKGGHANTAMGSGIGLSISKRIAKLMGGDLIAESELGKGSTFTLTIQAKEIATPLTAITPKVNLNLHILLVEDIEVNIIVAKNILEKQGYRVDIAMSGKEALQLFEQNDYDLVLLDIQLPDMTGFDIAQHLRQKYESGEYDHLPPLIALTANVMQNKRDYQQQGMDDVLRKPLSMESLNQCLVTYFGETIEPTSHQAKTDNALKHTLAEHFDYDMLKELAEMLGIPFLRNNLTLFKAHMPMYLAELQHQYALYQHDTSMKNTVISAAHKIKGAAASVGLKRIQQIAQQAQNDSHPHWESQIGIWIQQIHTHWQRDVEQLDDYLVQNNAF
ncbi:aerobic respiration two-component sensor histidine kinase ArcB [Conservatibacter flavescens]|uniref:Aerobic respiration control sensor protein n=1 Tax=Conservatibacter flavescens TaxID=28161 RepID=A0A2M8S3Q6_9PAST|nr:aerobic respiration two-component sensor histidine kinase ArcB [Conservatibacter flavescens]PJG85784.1 aerobic respiration two-component sensor histidine kinase ArcB [Conservatibacter flavescens]